MKVMVNKMAQYPDISHWIPVKDWKKVKENCGFLISKATQGTGYIDPTLESFIKGCEGNNIPYWLYTFLDKGSEKAQAEFMVKVCKDKVGKMFKGYVLDVESGNTASGVQSALNYLKSLGGKCMIYTMYAQYNTYKNVIDSRGTHCAWWEARYGRNTGNYNTGYPCHDGVDLHQYTSKGTVEGIGYPVDLNRIKGTKSITFFTGTQKKKQKKEEKPVKKTVEEIAKEVIAGKWGNGEARKKKLKEAGYNYAEVQKKVNALLNNPKKALKVGAIIRIKRGAKQFNKAIGFTKVVYNTPYRVLQISNNRLVFSDIVKGTVIGAINKSDCYVV